MAWILLIIAGLFEIGWPLGFKLASMHSKYFIWFIGTVLLGILFFHDSANIFRLLFLSLILIGIVGLKLVH